MSRIFIYSTLSNDQRYRLKDGRTVLVAGKANVANKQLVTPKGVVTSISEDEFNQLQENIVFQAHARNGFIAGSHDRQNPETFASRNLAGADKAAQDTPASARRRNPAAAKAQDSEG